MDIRGNAISGDARDVLLSVAYLRHMASLMAERNRLGGDVPYEPQPGTLLPFASTIQKSKLLNFHQFLVKKWSDLRQKMPNFVRLTFHTNLFFTVF